LCTHTSNKHQIPNTKHQINSKLQNPNSKEEWTPLRKGVSIRGMKAALSLLVVATFSLALPRSFRAAEPAVISLWPGTAPGETNSIGEEKDMTKPGEGLVAGKQVIRVGNVSKPTATLYRAPKDKDTGAAVVVFPGGAYNILALDLEGTEVCEWLNTIGVNAVLLKYRVPKRAGLEKHTAALQDAQRTFGVVRSRAKEFGIDPNRIGVLGFSAGGHLAAALSASVAQRTYPAVDDADRVSCRPDFSILIYPAYLTLKDQNDKISPETAVSSNTPPAFIVMTQDDPIRVETALFYSLALKQARVPFELHVYPKGGHGYGLRRNENLVTAWPDRAADWMHSRGLLNQ
jgi:acetyl esterase/lipase